MEDTLPLFEATPLQDIDLLQRLTRYFEELDTRLRHGQGWVIFNASDARAGRIHRFLRERVSSADFPFSHFFLTWRDFALTTYLIENELRDNLNEVPDVDGDLPLGERQIAARVSRQTLTRMASSDLLILSGLTPRFPHEVRFLEETIDRRQRGKLATILTTPEQPHELAIEMSRASTDGLDTWTRLANRLYETSLVAV